jgi:hypothetical protein
MREGIKHFLKMLEVVSKSQIAPPYKAWAEQKTSALKQTRNAVIGL